MARTPQQTLWRYRVFAATWLSYAGYYFCRKPFYISKAALSEQFGWDPSLLGLIGSAFLIAYTVGQFVMGWAGSRWGPRILLLSGMAVSVAANLMFGFANSWGVFMAFMVVNGLAQSTGWSNNVAAMAPWFEREERGTVMGFWATNYQVGGVLANGLAAWVLGRYGFTWSFWVCSLVLLFVWAFFLFNQRNKPEDLGLEAINKEGESEPDAGGALNSKGKRLHWTRDIWKNILLIGAVYFFIKFIRYALWSWTPFLLRRDYGMDLDTAGYLSTAFDLAGVVGVIAAGYLSDKFFAGRRAKISFYFLLGMTGATWILYALGPTSLLLFGISLGLVGFTLYGPDALLTGAGAIDVSTLRSAAFSAGIINGMGAVGSVLQEFVMGKVLDTAGATTVFAILLGSAVMAVLLLSVLMWRNRYGHADL